MMIETIAHGLAGAIVAAAGLYLGKHIGRRQGRVSALEDASDVFRNMADDLMERRSDMASVDAAVAVAIMLQNCARCERLNINLKTPLAERGEPARDG